ASSLDNWAPRTLGGSAPKEIVTDGVTAYWIESTGEILACSVAGCSAPSSVCSPSTRAVSVAVDDDYLYWTTEDGAVGARRKSLMVPPTLLATSEVGPTALRAGSRALFWINPKKYVVRALAKPQL